MRIFHKVFMIIYFHEFQGQLVNFRSLRIVFVNLIIVKRFIAIVLVPVDGAQNGVPSLLRHASSVLQHSLIRPKKSRVPISKVGRYRGSSEVPYRPRLYLAYPTSSS